MSKTFSAHVEEKFVITNEMVNEAKVVGHAIRESDRSLCAPHKSDTSEKG